VLAFRAGSVIVDLSVPSSIADLLWVLGVEGSLGHVFIDSIGVEFPLRAIDIQARGQIGAKQLNEASVHYLSKLVNQSLTTQLPSDGAAQASLAALRCTDDKLESSHKHIRRQKLRWQVNDSRALRQALSLTGSNDLGEVKTGVGTGLSLEDQEDARMARELEDLVADVKAKKEALGAARAKREQRQLRTAAELRTRQLKVEAAALEAEIRALGKRRGSLVGELGAQTDEELNNAAEIGRLQALLRLTSTAYEDPNVLDVDGAHFDHRGSSGVLSPVMRAAALQASTEVELRDDEEEGDGLHTWLEANTEAEALDFTAEARSGGASSYKDNIDGIEEVADEEDNVAAPVSERLNMNPEDEAFLSSSGADDSDHQGERRDERFARRKQKSELTASVVLMQAVARRYLVTREARKLRAVAKEARLAAIGPMDLEDWVKERSRELLEVEMKMKKRGGNITYRTGGRGDAGKDDEDSTIDVVADVEEEDDDSFASLSPTRDDPIAAADKEALGLGVSPPRKHRGEQVEMQRLRTNYVGPEVKNYFDAEGYAMETATLERLAVERDRLGTLRRERRKKDTKKWEGVRHGEEEVNKKERELKEETDWRCNVISLAEDDIKSKKAKAEPGSKQILDNKNTRKGTNADGGEGRMAKHDSLLFGDNLISLSSAEEKKMFGGGGEGRADAGTESKEAKPEEENLSFAVGSRVNVWWEEECEWFAGRVTAAHLSTATRKETTCDIIYDDGDSEKGVALALIRLEVDAEDAGVEEDNSGNRKGSRMQDKGTTSMDDATRGGDMHETATEIEFELQLKAQKLEEMSTEKQGQLILDLSRSLGIDSGVDDDTSGTTSQHIDAVSSSSSSSFSLDLQKKEAQEANQDEEEEEQTPGVGAYQAKRAPPPTPPQLGRGGGWKSSTNEKTSDYPQQAKRREGKISIRSLRRGSVVAEIVVSGFASTNDAARFYTEVRGATVTVEI
jgi:hypothetical protein